MLTTINDCFLAIAAPLLAWLLWLPTDVELILVSVATGAVLTFARPWTTNQDLLRRCHQDKRRLKQLLKEARREQDQAAVRRYKASIGLISLKTVQSEGLPLLVAIVPVAILAVWCFHRLEFHPLQADEPVAVHAYVRFDRLRRAAKESLPVAKLAKSFGGQPKDLATSAAVGRDSSAACLRPCSIGETGCPSE